MTAFLGIYREAACSPGRHRDNDAAILELAAAGLEARGHRVTLTDAESAERAGRDAAVVFSMSRSPLTLEMLLRWARDGKLVVNHPAAVMETARARLAACSFASVTLPKTELVPTAPALRSQVAVKPEGRWVKGGDLYASRREDVHRVDSAEGFERALDDFDRRGISTAVLQDHVEGREIKFYAVGADGFFHWLDSSPTSLAAVGDGEFRPHAIDAGVAASLEIFGGDVIIRSDGTLVLIDLNDWPSFAPCLEPGADAIAHYLEARYLERYAAALPAPSAAPSA